MPANANGITMKADPGMELACRAHEMDFEENGTPVRRGIISHYATATLASASDMGSWLDLIERRSRSDLSARRIKPFHKPSLQTCGDPRARVIGERRGAGVRAGP